MRKTTLLATLLCLSLTPVLADAETAYRDWQLKQIFSPTPAQLKLEQLGRVTTYDGLRDTDVEHAMDAQFDRVDRMMFIRTVITDDVGQPQRDEKTGAEITEDDDC